LHVTNFTPNFTLKTSNFEGKYNLFQKKHFCKAELRATNFEMRNEKSASERAQSNSSQIAKREQILAKLK
jgi:hypothetical protein